MSSPDASPPLDALIALAVKAGREIIAIREKGVSASRKADGSPVTLADRRAEAIILEGLKALAPDTPVLAEEETAAGRVPELGARFFCVDPLDGTRDFTEGSDEFTVNIALVEDATPVIGVIYAPATGVLYAGERSAGSDRALKGAWDARSGKESAPLSPFRAQTRGDAWRVTASRRSTGKRTLAFIDAINKGNAPEAEILRSSSSLKFGLLAEGAADLYPRFGEVSEWDAAAGHAILAAAGGGLIRLNGEPVAYGRAQLRFIINGFVAYGGAAAEAEARRVLKSLGAQDAQ